MQPIAASEPLLLTVAEAAAVARVSRATIRRHIDAGEIPALKVGANRKAALRIPKAEFLAWLFGEAQP
jgi:excisionase family DNA binding protein